MTAELEDNAELKVNPKRKSYFSIILSTVLSINAVITLLFIAKLLHTQSREDSYAMGTIHPDYDYALLEDDDTNLCLLVSTNGDLLASCLSHRGLQGICLDAVDFIPRIFSQRVLSDSSRSIRSRKA